MRKIRSFLRVVEILFTSKLMRGYYKTENSKRELKTNYDKYAEIIQTKGGQATSHQVIFLKFEVI